MRRRSLILIVFLLFLLLPALCRGGEIIRSRLENGMRVVLREDHTAPVAAFQVWVEVGSADERPAEAGMTHFIEHMIFKGTHEMRAGELAGTIERYGGRINAYTSYEYTIYHVVIASRYQEKGLKVLADTMQHPSFDSTELAREKEIR